MDKPISLKALVTLYELYEAHTREFQGFSDLGRFDYFVAWILGIQDDSHEGAGHCHHCKLAWAAINRRPKPMINPEQGEFKKEIEATLGDLGRYHQEAGIRIGSPSPAATDRIVAAHTTDVARQVVAVLEDGYDIDISGWTLRELAKNDKLPSDRLNAQESGEAAVAAAVKDWLDQAITAWKERVN